MAEVKFHDDGIGARLVNGRRVVDGQIVDVPDDAVYGLTQSALWSPADDDAHAAHDAGVDAVEEAMAEAKPGTKAALIEQAAALGVDTDGTMAEIQERIDTFEGAHLGADVPGDGQEPVVP